MCTKVMVCHGDRPAVLEQAYSKHNISHMRKDNTPAKYYITRDGKYAVDADYVSVADLEKEDFDLKGIPKIALGKLS